MADLLIKNVRMLYGTHASDVRCVAGRSMAFLPAIENAWLTADKGRITGFGAMSGSHGISDQDHSRVIDATGRSVLPGWCDPHTHVVFAAPREGEFVDRILGLTYQEIAAKGGGILNSARILREMPEDVLYEQARRKLLEMMHQGTVAIEIKSGYGLTLESELLMLRVIKRLKSTMPIPIKATLLAAHALPPEYKEDRNAYLDLICDRLIPRVADDGLADYIDTFCETNYFTVAEMERVLETGARYGIRGKVHVNQFTSIGGIQAAIAHKALSVDHLEVMTPEDMEALADAFSKGASPIPTLLPSCSFFLRIPYGPAREMMDKGLPIALATDHNPGSTPSGNMNFVLSLACIQLRMLPEEAINAMTLNAAAAMELSNEVGSIAIGKRANLIMTREVPSLAYLPYAFGSDHIHTVLVDGEPIGSREIIS